MRDSLSKIVSLLHLVLAIVFNICFLINALYPHIIGRYFYIVDAYKMVIDSIAAPLIVLIYLALIFLNRKVALKWWRVLLTVLPLIFVLAIINDMRRFNLSFFDMLNPKRPVIYNKL